MRRIELSPEKAAIVDKQVDKIRSTISYAVKRSGRTSGGISLMAGLSKGTVGNFEKGYNGISLSALILIADELGLEIVIQEKEELNE